MFQGIRHRKLVGCVCAKCYIPTWQLVFIVYVLVLPCDSYLHLEMCFLMNSSFFVSTHLDAPRNISLAGLSGCYILVQG